MVIGHLSPLFSYDDVTKEMFYSPPTVNAVPQWWVKDFVRTKILENYHPHITLGMGVLLGLNLPISFIASRLALCHLGTHCTCKKILTEFKLG